MSYVICIVPLLSLRACNARHLGLVTDKIHLIGKDLDNSKLHSTLTALKLQHSEPEELQAQEKHIEEAGQVKPLATSARANFIKGKDSLLQDTEEPVMDKENDMVEDVVAMDYAQPQRKPPIHNRKL